MKSIYLSCRPETLQRDRVKYLPEIWAWDSKNFTVDWSEFLVSLTVVEGSSESLNNRGETSVEGCIAGCLK